MKKHGDYFDYIPEEFHYQHKEPPYYGNQITKFVGNLFGFNAEIKGFNPTNSGLFWHPVGDLFSAYCEWEDPKTRSKCTIYVNINDAETRQRFSIPHECTHLIQDFDSSFFMLLNRFPPEIHKPVLERLADRNAALMLAPPDKVNAFRDNGYSDEEIAGIFLVSTNVIRYTDR